MSGLLQGKNQGRSAEELEAFGKQAAKYWREGQYTTIGSAVVGTIKEASLSAEQVKRVVEAANTDAFLDEFHKLAKTAKHGYVDFGAGVLADPDRVLAELNTPLNKKAHVVSNMDDYKDIPKVAAPDLTEKDWEDVFGKHAEETPSNWAQTEKLRQMFKGAYNHAFATLEGTQVDLDVAKQNLLEQAKLAVMSGASLGDLVKAWSSVTDEPILVKSAFAVIGNDMAEKFFPEQEDMNKSFAKVAAGVVNTDHPLVQAFVTFGENLSKVAELREDVDGLAATCGELDTLVKEGKDLAQKGLWNALGELGEHVVSPLAGKAGDFATHVVQGFPQAASEAVGPVTSWGKRLSWAGKHLPKAALLSGLGLAVYNAQQALSASPMVQHGLSYIPGTRQESLRRQYERDQGMQQAMMHNMPYYVM